MAYDDRETGLTVEDRGSKLGLPQNQDAEANVLAAMLLSPEVVEEAQVELQPDDFYRPIHKTIYIAMVDMYNSRIPIDSISLIDYLRSINKLDAVGGEAYILELMGQTLSLVNWQHQPRLPVVICHEHPHSYRLRASIVSATALKQAAPWQSSPNQTDERSHM